MSYKSIVQNLSKTAFTLIGDLKTPVTYRRESVSAYDPVTDSETKTTLELSVEGVVVYTEAVEREAAQVTYYHAKLILHSDELGELVPQEADTVTIQGSLFKVNRVKSPPGDSIYILMLIRI